jgi:hypothetical protein
VVVCIILDWLMGKLAIDGQIRMLLRVLLVLVAILAVLGRSPWPLL